MAQVVARASQLPSDQSTRLGSARKGLGAHRTEARALERWAARGEPCQRGQRLQEPRRALSLPPPLLLPLRVALPYSPAAVGAPTGPAERCVGTDSASARVRKHGQSLGSFVFEGASLEGSEGVDTKRAVVSLLYLHSARGVAEGW